jgi:alpha-glucuronidase
MEKWGKAWLNYRPIGDYQDKQYFSRVYYNAKDEIVENAVNELALATEGLFGEAIEKIELCENREQASSQMTSGILLELVAEEALGEEGFSIKEEKGIVKIAANNSAGILYGVFHLIRSISMKQGIKDMDVQEEPSNPHRMINHWDNLDGSIERGYAGRSIFFEKDEIILNERTKDYARMLASIGMNGIVINNVNVKAAATHLITTRYFEKLKVMAQLFGGYGIRLYLSLNYAAPVELEELDTADPLELTVIEWWQNRAKEVFENIPNFGGFLVKADSEGRPGPFTYHRTHADGANMLAKAVKPYGGKIIWRCFVYNCQQDWRDKKTDRARAGYDHFKPLDGQFDENVILQIKNGPMDFQVREPVSPLFGALEKTNQILEFQITQEYTGQQKHVCYLLPMWKEILDFKTYCKEKDDTVADIISGKTFKQKNCGIAAVVNVGADDNWTGHDLAAANLYGFGRISWNPAFSSEAIAKEWICQTFSLETKVMQNIETILMNSWPIYEKYTSPLGIGWMVNPNHHYGPNVDGYEYDRWGTYHRADYKGMGVERNISGTGYTSLYHEPNRSLYEHLETTPEELLLFFHYVEYTYRLKSSKTLIQHIYDTHFEGVEDVEAIIKAWQELEGLVDEKAYKGVYERLLIQLESSKEWRDRINTYFFRKSGIEDEKKRVIY